MKRKAQFWCIRNEIYEFEISLLLFFGINFVNGDFREDYLETFLQFQSELSRALNDET